MKWLIRITFIMLLGATLPAMAKDVPAPKAVPASVTKPMPLKPAPAKTAPAHPTASDTTYTDEKPNIVLNSKQMEFVVKLKSNPTTGYSWFLRDYDENLLVPVKHGREAATGGLIGAPGYETFTFKVKPIATVVPQETSLRFVYMRPWTGIENSTQTVFHVTFMGK